MLLFDSLIRDMHSVLLTLARFPPESQVILLAAFQSIATILEDPDLLSRHADSETVSTSSDKRADKFDEFKLLIFWGFLQNKYYIS